MEENTQPRKNKRTVAAIIAVASCVVIIFLCIFSLYHLPERDPVETPELAEDATVAELPAEDFAETNDIMSASQEEVSDMLGELEMQYENAKINAQPYEAEQAGLRLAMAYWKAGQPSQAKELVGELMSNYGYDESFVAKCQEFLNIMQSKGNVGEMNDSTQSAK